MLEWNLLGCWPVRWRPLADRDTISVGGFNPWRYQWNVLRNGVPLVLTPPRYTNRQFWAKTYHFQADGRCVRFAVAHADKMYYFFVPTTFRPGATFVANEPKYEGHWRGALDQESELPWPIPDMGWQDRAAFLALLNEVEGTAERIPYRGLSLCRLCGRRNGNEGLRIGGWEWPVGFRHYLAEHQVRPSTEFQAFVHRWRQAMQKS